MVANKFYLDYWFEYFRYYNKDLWEFGKKVLILSKRSSLYREGTISLRPKWIYGEIIFDFF